ncbi:uroporphyrinogen-III C-methyltransferase [Rhodocytophaga rosea]|uniref:uroporphyrinogen-III C-methyltransferase n=1 Tax=Rhodocytophaga rosea TaxID=2704465 RepID=A0A6C0GHQ6_9BACT|nr:uroporphyrinogen-III C-methyltransferase [Rhodocytophaga rosea]QHT67489.1 uroporphyrinogen-III C-methyltransferase [Rhodocytophaga rosea]
MAIPTLTLVGAGPGDPELISLKGIKALSKADVVLYDALVHPDLLVHAPEEAIKIFVGKRSGFCEFAQKDIHDLIVYHALHHGHVVRLKGGDPFVFGRGYEEITHARNFNIATEVIPGISSCIAVPEAQHIPLTCRGINESFWVLTGTTMNHQLSNDIQVAVQSSATLVILMGMKNLRQIVEIFTTEGKTQTPVAIIQQGTWAEEKVAVGTIETIADLSEKQGLINPAVIVIGEVVALHPQFVREEVAKRFA